MRSHYEPEEIIADLSAEVLQHIQSFKERNRITAHTILLGAWAMLQAEMAENSDVLISMIVSGRPESLDDADSIVGLFQIQCCYVLQMARWGILTKDCPG